MASPGNTTTPQKRYAGPTWHASPAPSTLPVPKFQARSVGNTSSLQAAMDAETPATAPRSGPFSTNTSFSSATSTPLTGRSVSREESPLDFLFDADRKEKARLSAHGTPSDIKIHGFPPVNNGVLFPSNKNSQSNTPLSDPFNAPRFDRPESLPLTPGYEPYPSPVSNLPKPENDVSRTPRPQHHRLPSYEVGIFKMDESGTDSDSMMHSRKQQASPLARKAFTPNGVENRRVPHSAPQPRGRGRGRVENSHGSPSKSRYESAVSSDEAGARLYNNQRRHQNLQSSDSSKDPHKKHNRGPSKNKNQHHNQNFSPAKPPQIMQRPPLPEQTNSSEDVQALIDKLTIEKSPTNEDEERTRDNEAKTELLKNLLWKGPMSPPSSSAN